MPMPKYDNIDSLIIKKSHLKIVSYKEREIKREKSK